MLLPRPASGQCRLYLATLPTGAGWRHRLFPKRPPEINKHDGNVRRGVLYNIIVSACARMCTYSYSLRKKEGTACHTVSYIVRSCGKVGARYRTHARTFIAITRVGSVFVAHNEGPFVPKGM